MLRRIPRKSVGPCVPGVLAIAGLLALGGCAPTVNGDLAPERPTIVFQNRTDNYVRVYLMQNEVRWPLGRVRPFSTEELHLPSGLAHSNSSFLQLAVIPLGASISTLYGQPNERHMIRSAPEQVGNLLMQKWQLSGGQIWGLPDPRPRLRIPLRARATPGGTKT